MHMKFRARGLWLLLLLTATAPAQAQTLVNPDISVVGDFRTEVLKGETAEALDRNEVEFVFEEIEFNINAYLNPYMRADVFVGIHGTEGPVAVEEGSITVLRGLPLSMQLKAGKYLLDLGKINTQHPHQWSWLKFPLMHRTMLGPEGARVVGANVSTLQAAGETAVTLSLNAFSGESWGHAHEDDHGDAVDDAHDHGDVPAEIMYSGRLSAFRSLTDFLSAELGASAFRGEFDPVEDLVQTIAALDWKLRWRPDSYRAFVWVAETMVSRRDVVREHGAETDGAHDVETVDAVGAFTSMEYQFRRRYDAGAFFDWTQDAEIDDAETTAAGAFFGFMPAEETARFSVVYRWEDSDLYEYDNHSVTFQILWALGPHKPHTY